MWENRNENPHRQVRKNTPIPASRRPRDESIADTSWCHPGSEGCALPLSALTGRSPAISAQRALYACSADVLHALHRRSLSANGSLSERRAALLLPRHGIFIFQLLSEWSFSCASSYASQGRRAAIRESAFPPRPDWSRRERCRYRTDAACA